MADFDDEMQRLLEDAGADMSLRRYLRHRGFIKAGLFAAAASSTDELDAALLQPLIDGYTIATDDIIQLDALAVTVAKARLRFIWKKSQPAGAAPTAATAPTATASAATSSKSSKELPSGWWAAQIAKYEAGSGTTPSRTFPQDELLGAETVLARLVHEDKTKLYTALSLTELVEARFFNAAGEPNPIHQHRHNKKSTTLTIKREGDHDDGYSLEAEKEAPWNPKSTLAILDCLTAIRWAWTLCEFGEESDIVRFINWFQKKVRQNSSRLEQMKSYWEAVAWRIALQSRSGGKLADIVDAIIDDTQAFQEAMARDVPSDRPAKKQTLQTSTTTQHWTPKWESKTSDFKGKSRKGGGKGGKPVLKRWQPYSYGDRRPEQGSWQRDSWRSDGDRYSGRQDHSQSWGSHAWGHRSE